MRWHQNGFWFYTVFLCQSLCHLVSIFLNQRVLQVHCTPSTWLKHTQVLCIQSDCTVYACTYTSTSCIIYIPLTCTTIQHPLYFPNTQTLKHWFLNTQISNIRFTDVNKCWWIALTHCCPTNPPAHTLSLAAGQDMREAAGDEMTAVHGYNVIGCVE